LGGCFLSAGVGFVGHNPHLHGPADHGRHRQPQGAQIEERGWLPSGFVGEKTYLG